MKFFIPTDNSDIIKKMSEKIVIFTDGACSGNQNRKNRGGWGAVLKYGGKTKEICGGEKNTTNNRMELTACIESLKSIKRNDIDIEIYSDSSYIVNCIEKKWYIRWQKNGWMTSKKKPVENRDLWEKLLELLSDKIVTFKKVKGHAGIELNERADELAKKGIELI